MIQDNKVFDAVVVGGRIAGCATAIHLSKQGKEVLVLDRAKFPQPTVSTHLMKPDSVAMLHRLGLGPVLPNIGAPILQWFRQDFDGFVIEGRLPALLGYDYGYCIRREVLDDKLVTLTKKQPGVTFLEGFSVTELIQEQGKVVGVRGMYQGNQREARARIIIGADGRYSFVAQEVQAPTYWRVPIGRAAYYGYFKNVEPMHRPSIEIFIRKENWFYVFPTDANLHLVAMGIDSHRVAQFRPNRYYSFMEALQMCPEVAARLSCAELVDKVYLAYSPAAANFMRRPFGPGWALVGDAGMYFDPLLGQGMGTALRSAEILTEELLYKQDNSNFNAKRLWRYELRRNREFWDLYAYTCAMSPARKLTRLERAFYQKISKNQGLTRQYLAVASHISRVKTFLLYCLLHPLILVKR